MISSASNGDTCIYVAHIACISEEEEEEEEQALDLFGNAELHYLSVVCVAL